jgi:hypothetical protein
MKISHFADHIYLSVFIFANDEIAVRQFWSIQHVVQGLGKLKPCPPIDIVSLNLQYIVENQNSFTFATTLHLPLLHCSL